MNSWPSLALTLMLRAAVNPRVALDLVSLARGEGIVNSYGRVLVEATLPAPGGMVGSKPGRDLRR